MYMGRVVIAMPLESPEWTLMLVSISVPYTHMWLKLVRIDPGLHYFQEVYTMETMQHNAEHKQAAPTTHCTFHWMIDKNKQKHTHTEQTTKHILDPTQKHVTGYLFI